MEAEPEERLFVTYTNAPGEFFGQFEKRPEKALKELEAELMAVYCSNPGTTSNIPLLYADVQSHIGDYGVIQWSADGNLYRVKITNEDANEVNCMQTLLGILPSLTSAVRLFRWMFHLLTTATKSKFLAEQSGHLFKP